MASDEIDVERLRKVINDILDHVVQDLGIVRVAIEPAEDFYWCYSYPEAYDSSKKHQDPEVGRLTDDADLLKNVRRGQGGDVTLNLVHVWPLVKYIGEKIKR
jgi:hypothetical protein